MISKYNTYLSSFNRNFSLARNIPVILKQFFLLLQVVYALLMPASATLGEDASDFQYNFLKSGGLPLVLSMLTRNNFLPSADMETRRGAYLNALKIAKLLLTAVGFGHVKAVAEACQPNAEGNIPVSPVRLYTQLTQTETHITGFLELNLPQH